MQGEKNCDGYGKRILVSGERKMPIQRKII
jgi:hypothetical protein